MGSAVTKYGHVAWRVIAVVAFAGTAALAVTLSRAPARPDHAALSSNLTGSPCATSGLEAWLGLAQAAGSTTADRLEPSGTYYTLEFTNVSARVCSLYGYPGRIGLRRMTRPAGPRSAARRPTTPRSVPGR